MHTLLINMIPDFGGSFNWDAAIFVGAVVLGGSLLVINGALATPFVAVQKGKTLRGTLIAVTIISTVVGAVGGAAAGFPRGTGSGQGGTSSGVDGGPKDGEGENEGLQGTGKTEENNANDQTAAGAIKRQEIEHFFDIHFRPEPSNPKVMANYTAIITTYKLQDGEIVQSDEEIVKTSGTSFMNAIEGELKRWVKRKRSTSKKPLMRVFLQPDPGRGYRDQWSEMAKKWNADYTEENTEFVSAKK